MKFLVLLCSVCSLCSARSSIRDEIRARFQTFQARHSINFDSTIDQNEHQQFFGANLDFIKNYAGQFFKVGLNKYAHLSAAQIHKMNTYRSGKSTKPKPSNEPKNKTEPVDWVARGAVTPVKDQGRCGSCWTFSATGGIEAAVFRKTGKLPSLSEQYLVDCATAAGYGSGCNGGNENNAFDYIIKSKGIPFEADYPYQEKQGKCNKSIAKSTTMVKYTHVNANEADVAAALDKYGPLSIAIYASAQSFQLYKSGVYYEPACKNSYRDINHAVLLVGYGTENGVDYWLVKNSWGTTWGEKGYIKMARNRKNNCGIVTDVSYVTV